ncbi:type II toxin-antitoxin system RelE/ParE family toxin [Erwiniaceae bacterium BAC15a-03b]|uniref:Type II toxin-antitoxin system RelE/ParE family toxin n=1 Tax=Winslowiella arboricola TaxID=2978220 RepID=A0A9J6PNS7_9GAMM|nr:type II toxin-antitoxin system RelE/ParE family toxin [Winslowiella arboricola]MCU5773977.1 type II toxin-antitoxin system RelE/ParE family toxin [Winslowiella arboricola]MCU5777296.1 type II toxin-antitoxin system RelE/ParE family toxin [Winslowiella arboricola]
MQYITERYKDGNGKVPYTEWIKKLRKKDPRAASKIDIRIDRAEKGNFGDHKFERDGVWELRIDYGPGYRVYYAMDGNKIILLLTGGDKSGQKSDLDKAVQYWRDYQQE